METKEQMEWPSESKTNSDCHGLQKKIKRHPDIFFFLKTIVFSSSENERFFYLVS